VVAAFAKASGREVPVAIHPRRAGDIATCFANAQSAKSILKWEAEFDLQRMVEDAWRWQSGNPDGYPS